MIAKRKQHFIVIRKPDETHRRNGKLITRSFKPFLCPVKKARMVVGHLLAIQQCECEPDSADFEDARVRADLGATAARLVVERYLSGLTTDNERSAAVQYSIRRAYGVMESVVANGILPRKAA